MDNTTKWLIRVAAAVVIGAGLLSVGKTVVSVLNTQARALHAKTYCFFKKCFKYSEFRQAVKEGKVSQVLISPDSGTAFVQLKNGKEGKVNLAPDKDLLRLLQENNVDLAVAPFKD